LLGGGNSDTISGELNKLNAAGMLQVLFEAEWKEYAAL